MLWHIMNLYARYNHKNFYVALGYKGEIIQKYFQKCKLKKGIKINCIKTGKKTMTGGRIKRLKKYLKSDFLLTYGDGLSNVNINKLSKFHISHKKIATLTMVIPPAKYGTVEVDKNIVTNFQEKPKGDNRLINGGFFVLNNKIFNFIKNDKSIFEEHVIIELIKLKELQAYKLIGFWQSMDSLKDKIALEELW